MRCKGCGQAINGLYTNVNGKAFHPECFTCHYCGKPIEGDYHKHFLKYFHPPCFRKKKGVTCDHCGNVLEERWIVFEKGKYHSECYQRFMRPKCGICGSPIDGEYTTEKGEKFHLNCYKGHKLPKCDVCLQPLEGRFIVDPWGARSHEKHGKKTISCDSCARIISNNTSKGGFRLGDGRIVCGFCTESAVDTSDVANRIAPLVMRVLAEAGVSGFPTNFPIYLTDSRKLKKLSDSKNPDNARGVTRSNINYLDHRKISSSHAIHILYGLPRLEFEGVLAHELLHVWLNEREIKMSVRMTEGFCNLGSYLIYNKDASRFAKILLERMDNNPDPNYGKGFRKMKKKLQKTGWERLLQEVSSKV